MGTIVRITHKFADGDEVTCATTTDESAYPQVLAELARTSLDTYREAVAIWRVEEQAE